MKPLIIKNDDLEIKILGEETSVSGTLLKVAGFFKTQTVENISLKIQGEKQYSPSDEKNAVPNEFQIFIGREPNVMSISQKNVEGSICGEIINLLNETNFASGLMQLTQCPNHVYVTAYTSGTIILEEFPMLHNGRKINVSLVTEDSYDGKLQIKGRIMDIFEWLADQNAELELMTVPDLSSNRGDINVLIKNLPFEQQGMVAEIKMFKESIVNRETFLIQKNEVILRDISQWRVDAKVQKWISEAANSIALSKNFIKFFPAETRICEVQLI